MDEGTHRVVGDVEEGLGVDGEDHVAHLQSRLNTNTSSPSLEADYSTIFRLLHNKYFAK
jgi:hypothetical protein